MRATATAVSALLIMCGQAWAGPLPDGGVTADEVAARMRAIGMPVEMASDKDGDPLIRSSLDEAKTSVWFYECNAKRRCHSIQFAAGWSGVGTSASQIAEWNRTKRFGRAYLDRQGDPWVEMDVDLEHGATTEALANNITRWQLAMRTFKTYIGR